ncbi:MULTISPECIES: sulfotransferase family protein [unclassified Solwaraspora]|uniref:sulfotransferase family protein n=1 Tax=unclassified Solwaraspora TaxID=2627926 RepID=UPI00259BA7AE|nr:sulfotransferase [Solwaraspora sp. WMMA2056]WJK39191.1 sulfotransferase [Solwaraspora sp. WMMA2056]
MSWKHHLAVRIARSTGVQISRRGGRGLLVRRPQRLLRQPVFVLSSVRSGSTLLRMMLDSHSAIYAPHELHLSKLRVQLGDHYITNSMAELGLDAQEVTHLLWDRVLDTALQRSGKRILAEKTPHNVFMWSRIARVWPDARFLFLLRHPAAILDSWSRARPQQTPQEAADSVGRYLSSLAEARRALPGHTVRYEDLTADPAAATRRICAFLGLEWEPAMLEYGRFDHGTIKAGLGDWTGRIRTGTVQPPREVPDLALPDPLYDLATGWGYPARRAG